MSKLSRHSLLTSLVRHELRCQHVLPSSTDPLYNQELYKRSIEGWIFLTEDLMCESSIVDQGRNTRIKNLIQLLNSTDTSLILSTLKRSYDILIDHISGKSELSNFADFKGRFDGDEIPLLGFLLSPIKEPLSCVISSQTVFSRGCYHSDSKRAMWICSHYLLFLTKTNFVGVGLEDKALTDYLQFEQEVKNFELETCELYIPALQRILKRWLQDWDYDGSRSKHGPGSVADCARHKHQKYLSFAQDTYVSRLYRNDVDVLDQILPFGSWSRSLERCSQLVFVPKNITKLRSISMEPTTLQYLQQGCMESLYNYFDTHIELKKILKLKDQTQNKSFAYHGSITNDYATIDLSHASDSVHWGLTKRLFARVPKLARWLLSTRSTHTLLPDGSKLALAKFAPMGSALCFPVESLIFAAIARLSIDLSKEEALDRNNDTGIRTKYNYLTVYGDDIIIPTYAANTCIKLLKLFGFTPNEEKSYLDGPFKESCGGNYYCGYDITAIKFSLDLDLSCKFGVSPEAYTALCSYANLAYERGLSLFRLYCIKLIFEAGRKPLFCDSLEQSPAIYSPQPTNFHLRKRYNKEYQKYELLYTGIKTVSKEANSLINFTVKCPSFLGGKHDIAVYHTEHIFLYDSLLLEYLNNKRKEVVTSLSQQNAAMHGNVLSFDSKEPYARSTLLPQVLKYTLCKTDA